MRVSAVTEKGLVGEQGSPTGATRSVATLEGKKPVPETV